MVTRITALIVKELYAVFADRQARLLLFMPVVLQTALFPFAVTLDVQNNTLAVLNRDSGPASIELIQRFGKASAFTHLIILKDEAEMASVMDNQQALISIYFPINFSRDVNSGQNATVQAILDGRRSNSGQIALGYIQTMLASYSADQSSKVTVPAQVIVRNWYNSNLNYRFFVLPSLVALITTTGVLIVTSMSIAREREQGTFDQLCVSPLTTEMIMIGKTAPAILVALIQSTIILCATVFVYHVPFQGSLVLLYFSILCYAFALAGFGLLISSICATQQQAFMGVFTFMMPAILLSGYASPVDNMPYWLQVITEADPLRHLIVIVKSIFLKQVSVWFVLNNVWPLLIIAVVTISLANYIFRKQTS